MFRRIVLPVAFAAATAALVVPDARSQDKGAPKLDGIETADGVKLSARFYQAGGKPKNGSCVILIHDYKADPNKGAWGDLAATLTANGYHVLRFDFRGHGDSKDVTKEFWNNQYNKTVQGATKNPKPAQIDTKAFKERYYPALVNDLAAARTLLDLKNDLGQVNASSIYLIGAGDSAALGMLFLASEWHRERVEPTTVTAVKPLAYTTVSAGTGGLQGIESAGKDYGGCVWLSPSFPNTITKTEVKNLVAQYGRDPARGGSLREETAMLLIHGDKDPKGKTDAQAYYDEVMVAGGRQGMKVEKLEFVYTRAVKGTAVRGGELLGKAAELKTEDMILEFLNKMEEQRKNRQSLPRKYTTPRLVLYPSFGVG